MFSKRALIWSGVVVATAIIISFTSPPPPKPNQNIAKHDGQPATGAAAEPTEKRITSSTSEGTWDTLPGERRKPRGDDLAANDASRKIANVKDREAKTEAGSNLRSKEDFHKNKHLESGLAVHDGAGPPVKLAGEPVPGATSSRESLVKTAKEAPATGERKPAGFALAKDKAAAPDEKARLLEKKVAEEAVRSELKKSVPPIDAVVDSKPAPAKPAAAIPNQPESPIADAPKPGADLAPTGVVMPKAPSASKGAVALKAFGAPAGRSTGLARLRNMVILQTRALSKTRQGKP